MPPLVIPASVLIRIIWSSGGSQYAVNVIGAVKTGSVTVNQALADGLFADAKTAHTSSGLAALQPTTVTLSSLGVRDISGPNLPEFMGAGVASAGTAAGGKMLPPQTALCVTIRTAKAGRSYRGRMYVPGWHDTALSSTGTATAGASTAAKGFADNFSVAIAGRSLSLAVLSRKHLESNLATTTQVRDTIWDTVRKRAVPGI